jgi:hypothetical protein
MESLMPLARYLGDQLAIGRSVTDVAQELRDDASLPGRAYPAKFRASLAKQLLAQDKIRRKMGCAFRPSLVFKLDRVNQDGEWEVVNSQVVQASTEKEARHLASLKAGQEGKETWLNPRLSTCGRLPDGGGPRVIVDKYVS